MVPESWALIGKGKRDGLPMVKVAREKRDPTARLTIWTLVRKPNGIWYSVGQWISKGRYREFDRPQRLTDSYIDRKLLEYATHG